MADEREALEAIRALNGSKLGGNCLNVEVSIYVLVLVSLYVSEMLRNCWRFFCINYSLQLS